MLAQSAPSSNSVVKDLRAVDRLREIYFPHSSAAEGVGVRDSRYWHDAIEVVNAQHAELIAAHATPSGRS